MLVYSHLEALHCLQWFYGFYVDENNLDVDDVVDEDDVEDGDEDVKIDVDEVGIFDCNSRFKNGIVVTKGTGFVAGLKMDCDPKRKHIIPVVRPWPRYLSLWWGVRRGLSAGFCRYIELNVMVNITFVINIGLDNRHAMKVQIYLYDEASYNLPNINIKEILIIPLKIQHSNCI